MTAIISIKNIEKTINSIETALRKKLTTLEIGVLKDTRYNPRAATKTLATGSARKVQGGPRKKGRTITKSTNSDAANSMQEKYEIFTKPFENTENHQLIKNFFQKLWNKGREKAPLNSIRAMVLKPMLTGKYGHNYKKINGKMVMFRNSVDTGQLANSIAVKLDYLVIPRARAKK